MLRSSKRTISDQELTDLDAAGVRGVRYSYVKRLTNPPPPEEMVAMANRIKRLNWHIDLYCEAADLKDLEPHIKAIPIPVVFDHMAVPNIDKGVSDPEFQRYLQLFRDKKDCYAKVTCPERLTGSSKPEDWSKVLPFARAGGRIPRPRDHRHGLAASQHERGTDAQRR